VPLIGQWRDCNRTYTAIKPSATVIRALLLKGAGPLKAGH
jgi:hypothetical protein